MTLMSLMFIGDATAIVGFYYAVKKLITLVLDYYE